MRSGKLIVDVIKKYWGTLNSCTFFVSIHIKHLTANEVRTGKASFQSKGTKRHGLKMKVFYLEDSCPQHTLVEIHVIRQQHGHSRKASAAFMLPNADIGDEMSSVFARYIEVRPSAVPHHQSRMCN